MDNILLHKALSYTEIPLESKRTLNIGPRDTSEPILLASRGFQVDAVDKNIIEFPKDIDIRFYHIAIEDFDFQGLYHFILARNVFYFLSRESLFKIFQKCKQSLHTGGVMYFSVLGENDAWVQEKNYSFFTKSEIIGIFAGYELMNVIEKEGWGTTYSGNQKYWHTLNFIFRK